MLWIPFKKDLIYWQVQSISHINLIYQSVYFKKDIKVPVQINQVFVPDISLIKFKLWPNRQIYFLNKLFPSYTRTTTFFYPK